MVCIFKNENTVEIKGFFKIESSFLGGTAKNNPGLSEFLYIGGRLPPTGTFISYLRHDYISSETSGKHLFKGVGGVNATLDMGNIREGRK